MHPKAVSPISTAEHQATRAMEGRSLSFKFAKPRLRSPTQGGFTYLGILLFVLILAIASAGTAMLWSTVQRRVAEEHLLFIGGEFRLALRRYAAVTPQGQSPYPPTLEALLRDPRFPEVRRHLRKVYADPVTHRTDWVIVKGPDGGIVAIHSSSSIATFKRGQFPSEFANFEGKETYEQWVFAAAP